jgi:aspartyl-tRNA(Asn)/glutamyl-tRNA(Gln) amidotransferase subunit A
MNLYGRVSSRGTLPTMDHVRPLCTSVEDAALMLRAIAGYDELDPASVDVPVPSYGVTFQAQGIEAISPPRAASSSRATRPAGPGFR